MEYKIRAFIVDSRINAYYLGEKKEVGLYAKSWFYAHISFIEATMTLNSLLPGAYHLLYASFYFLLSRINKKKGGGDVSS